MQRKYPNLCKPITIGNVTFRNRMFSAPVGGAEITADCCMDRATTAFYELRAKGGAANVTASECMVDPETDGSHAFHLNTTQPGSLSGFAHTADAIKRHGAVPSLELSHSGQFAGTYMTDKGKKKGLTQFGPSDTVRADGLQVKALTREQIADIVRIYGEVAGLAKRVGFEMLMVHGGHGWLINQFFSPFFNQRTDEYGGSLENRVRFALEVLDSIRAAVGPGFPIEFRMSGSELFEGGYDLAGGIEIAQMLESRIDLLHVSAGSYQRGFATTHPSMFKDHGCNVYLAAEIKKHVTVPVATVGGLNDPAQMEEIIASGQADVVEMARALMADPYLPRKVLAGKEEDIISCLRCFVCMSERPVTATRRCAVNPLIGRELDGVEITPAASKKRVLVAGAGPAGLEAALTAAKRGHTVTLCEASDEIGGITKGEVAIPFKHEMYRLCKTLGKLANDAGVDIRLNTPVTPEYAEKFKPDALIVAVGSSPIVPPIEGINGANVIAVNDYYLQADEVGETAAVIGGGLAGCEMALHLALQGKKVTLFEMTDTVLRDANIRQRPILLAEMKEAGVSIHVNHTCTSINESSVTCTDESGVPAVFPAQTVICAAGQRARSAVADSLRDSAPFVECIGDCVRASDIKNAMYQAYHVALDI